MASDTEKAIRPLSLPEVGDDILSELLFEEITTDPEATQRWRRFSTANPRLAHDIWLRAQQESGNDPKTVKIALDSVSMATAGLELALSRQPSNDLITPMIGQLALFEHEITAA